MIFPYLFVNGEVLPKEKALIPIYDLGLLRGLGIFDFFRVWDGVPVFIEDHLDRLMHSLEVTGIPSPYTKAEWLIHIHHLINVNEATRAGFRIVVTGGYSEDGYSIPGTPNVYMMLHPITPYDPMMFEKGVSLITSEYQRDMPLAKTTMYIQAMKMQPAMQQAGATEVLYHWNGSITECSRCNIFFIDKNQQLITPSNSMLRGITRKQVIEIAEAAGIPVIKREVLLTELPDMEGAFLSATTKRVMGVVKIDDLTIGNGQVHPMCIQLRKLFIEKFDQYIAAARLGQMVL